MPGYRELLAANPEAFKEHEAEIARQNAAAEKARTDAAVAKALEDQKKAKPAAATLAELKAIVPEKMEGRADLILQLQESEATCVQAHAAVTARLSEQVEAARADKGKADEQKKGLGKAGEGSPALKLSGGKDASGHQAEETYMGLVQAEMERLRAASPNMLENDVRARAYIKISRERPDLLEAHQNKLAEEAHANQVNRRAGRKIG